MGLIDDLSKILNNCVDEESRNIFESRIKSKLYGDRYIFSDTILGLKRKWEIQEKEFFLDNIDRDLYIFGAGYRGQNGLRLLQKAGYGERIRGFIDNNRTLWGKEVMGKRVYEPEYMLQNLDCNVVISAEVVYAKDMYLQMVQMLGFPRENVFLPRRGYIRGLNGWIYFDVFEPDSDEVFLDCGSYDGESSRDFVTWTKGNYKKIYAFDPSKTGKMFFDRMTEREGIKDALFIPKGLWAQDDTLSFIEEGTGSRINEGGQDIVPVTFIDKVLGGEKATFIKMDIEGAELKALKGAQETIKKHRPRLAISLYHKPEDIVEIPLYIMELVPEYKFIIRQYNLDGVDCVLYAYI